MGAISVLIGASVTHSRVSVHIVNMKLLVLAACVALSAAWQPGPRDLCNNVNTEGGSYLLPHEKYCQLYYTCDLDGNQKPLFCPGRMLFAYGTGLSVCVTEGYSTFNCPKWSCSSPNDVGRRYPDTCCGKYWECTAPNQLSPKECNPGLRFDMNSESCQVNAICQDDQFCVDNFVASNNNDCRNSPSQNDPCKYKSEEWPFDRQCPLGTGFDVTTCGCTQFNEQCRGSGLTSDQLSENKKLDIQCRASGRMQWDNALTVVSDKLNRNVDHYFFKKQGFTTDSLDGNFGNDKWIYDYFYNDNTLYAPFAIAISVRFDNFNIQLGTEYVLLENRWSNDPSNTFCDPTIRITATYQGVIRGDRSWRFNIQATGENNQQSSASAQLTGQTFEYFRILFTFSTTSNSQNGIGGSVTNRGNSGAINGLSARFNSDNRGMGGAIRPAKCGFAIGRGLTGKVREFSVFEGCGNFQLLG